MKGWWRGVGGTTYTRRRHPGSVARLNATSGSLKYRVVYALLLRLPASFPICPGYPIDRTDGSLVKLCFQLRGLGL